MHLPFLKKSRSSERRVHDAGAVGPFFLVFAIFSAAIMQGLAAGTSSFEAGTLMAFGANYAPRTSQGEYWRLITCLFVDPNPFSVAFNGLAIAIFGLFLSRQIRKSSAFVLFTTFILSGVGGAIASSLYNPQAVMAGAAPAVFGIAGAVLTMGFRDRCKRWNWSVAAALIIYTWIAVGLSIANDWMPWIALAMGLVVGSVCTWIIVRFPRRDPLAQAAAMFSLLALFTLAYAQIQVGFDQLAFVEAVLVTKKHVQLTFAQIEQERRTSQINEIAASEKIEKEVVEPIEDTLKQINAYGTSEGETPWLVTERADFELWKQSLHVMTDVRAAQEALREARLTTKTDQTAAAKKLDLFWTELQPKLQKRLFELQNNNAKNLAAVLKQDIQNMTSIAIEIELLRTQTWIASLRSYLINSASDSHANDANHDFVEGSRLPASIPTSVELAMLPKVEEHLARFDHLNGVLKTTGSSQDPRVIETHSRLSELRLAINANLDAQSLAFAQSQTINDAEKEPARKPSATSLPRKSAQLAKSHAQRGLRVQKK